MEPPTTWDTFEVGDRVQASPFGQQYYTDGQRSSLRGTVVKRSTDQKFDEVGSITPTYHVADDRKHPEDRPSIVFAHCIERMVTEADVDEAIESIKQAVKP